MTGRAKNPDSDDVQKKLDHVIALMEHEGFELSDETIERARGVITGELDADEEAAKIVEKYLSLIHI